MNSTGWKITSLGWIALATISGLAVYFMGTTLRNVRKLSNVTLSKQTDE